MDVQKLNMRKLFLQDIRYEIPLFQRRYVWQQEEQWEPLWEDVRNTAETHLENNSDNRAHFLGAIVIQGLHRPVGRLEVRTVVDGQQRLTTMQLLLDAVQEVLEERDYGNSAEHLRNLVLNRETSWDGDEDKAFKVWPTLGDQDAFRQTMHNHLPSEEYKESRIVLAHEFFKLQVHQWLDERPEEADLRVTALEQVLDRLLEMVVIDLELDEDPHIIFETLNARGTPLLQSDLIKNMLLFEAGNAAITDTSQIWEFDTNWWNEEVFQGRLLRPRVDAFLNFWLTMRKQTEIAPNNVFSEFRRYFEGEGNNDAESLAKDIQRVSKAYAALEKVEVDAEIEPFLYRRGVMRAGVITPVLMWLFSSEASREQVMKSLASIESYLVRRMVCGMSARSYNRLFIELIGALEEAGADNAAEAITRFLKSQEAFATLWPDDQQLEDAFTLRPVYRLMTQGRTRIVLEGIEAGLRTDKADDQSVPRNLTIEHLMPRAWETHWNLPADVEDIEGAKADRDRLIHTIGNLTLTNNRLNPSLSNNPWEKKREELHKHITLFLNKDIVREPVWDEGRIEARSRQLARVATEVWPY